LMRRVVPAALALLLGACGGGGGGPSGATTTAKPPASCPGAAGQYSGPTSEKLCVTAERDASGNITLFDIQVLARCSVGFSESKLTVSDVTGPQTLTTTEAPSEANAPFKATVSIKPPITVGADGTFKSDN